MTNNRPAPNSRLTLAEVTSEEAARAVAELNAEHTFAVCFVSRVDGEVRVLNTYPESERAEHEARVARKNRTAGRARYSIRDL